MSQSSNDSMRIELITAFQNLPNMPADIADLLLANEYTTEYDLMTIGHLSDLMRDVYRMPQYVAMEERRRERHCRRCHGTYTNQDNGPSSCTIPHMFCHGHRWVDADGSYLAKCCPQKSVRKLGDGSWDQSSLATLGNCYEGSHTDVVDGGVEYNGVNILPCDRGIFSYTSPCIRARPVDHADPVFANQFGQEESDPELDEEDADNQLILEDNFNESDHCCAHYGDYEFYESDLEAGSDIMDSDF